MKTDIQIPINFYQEGDLVIAQSPALEIATQGENFDIAKKNFEELLEIFFEENDTNEKLEKVLLNCGWQKIADKIEPPKEIARVYQTVRLPIFAFNNLQTA